MDEQLLNDTLKQAGVLYRAQSLWLFDSALQDLVYRYSNLVGTRTVTASGEPLLTRSIKDAASGYKYALDHMRNQRDARLLFLYALLTNGLAVFAQRLTVTSASDSVSWDPFQCGALEFEQEYSGYSFRIEKSHESTNREMATTFLLEKLLPHGYLDIRYLEIDLPPTTTPPAC